MSKKHLKILEAFMSSELKKKPQTCLQTNYSEFGGKIESYSIVFFNYDSITGKSNSIPLDGFNELKYSEMIKKLTN